MPWGVVSGIISGYASTRHVAKSRYSPGWSDYSDADNGVIASAKRMEAAKSPDAWEAYMLKRRCAEKAARIVARGKRMSTRLERRREAIQAKWWARGRATLFLMAAIPLGVAFVAILWRLASWAVVS